MFHACKSILLSFLFIGIVLGVTGCAGGGKNVTTSATDTRVERSLEELEELLRARMQNEIKKNESYNSPGTAKFNGQKTSYYKEYYSYPDGDNFVVVEVQPRDSRTIPYQGTIKIAKETYATKIHGQRDTARKDEAYQKDSGFETVSFEWRNGDWYRRGALFVAVTSEKEVDGTWVSQSTNLPRTENYRDEEAPDLVEKGFFGRMSDRVLFWRN
jgi:hypothetical protein